MIQPGGFLGKLIDPLIKTGLSLMKNVIKPMAKCTLIPSELIAATSAADSRMYIKVLGCETITLIISNDEMESIKETVKFLEDSSLLLKGFKETFQNEAK